MSKEMTETLLATTTCGWQDYTRTDSCGSARLWLTRVHAFDDAYAVSISVRVNAYGRIRVTATKQHNLARPGSAAPMWSPCEMRVHCVGVFESDELDQALAAGSFAALVFGHFYARQAVQS